MKKYFLKNNIYVNTILGFLLSLLPTLIWGVILSLFSFVLYKSGVDTSWFDSMIKNVLIVVYILFGLLFSWQFNFIRKRFSSF